MGLKLITGVHLKVKCVALVPGLSNLLQRQFFFSNLAFCYVLEIVPFS